MRRRGKLALVASLAVVAACVLEFGSLWSAPAETYYRIQYAVANRYTRWRNAQPARVLPSRPGDRERYPRRDFGLVLEGNTGERVDTRAGLVTKDLVELPDTTVQLRLSEAQLDSLYAAVIRMRIFDVPEPHPKPALPPLACPNFKTRLLVRAGDATRSFMWESTDLWGTALSDDWKRLFALTDMLVRMVQADPVYRALPSARGAYL